jgi:diguanylate cyclase (GGDEF)-like protein
MAEGNAVSAFQISKFVIDLPTLCAVTFFIAVTAGLLLLFSWLQNRRVPALALWGLGYLLGAAAAVLLALRGLVPSEWSICGASALLCCAYGVMWGGARCFEGRPVRAPLIFAGAAIWLGACQFDSFYASEAARMELVSAILATYTLLGAREVWHAHDRELISRWPTLALLLLHAGFLSARIHFAGELTFPPLGDGPHRVAVFIMAFEALFTAFCLAFLRVNMSKERAELEQRKAALTDALTGVANRRAFFDLGEPLLARTFAERHSAALVLFDLDRFKEVNDTAGHQAGDGVLRAFSDLVASSMRPGDLFGRLGGEEFACLLPNASMAQALQACERIRREFAAMRFACLATNATVSVGVAMASEADRDLQALLATADRALYRAKAEGRNRVAPAPLVLVDTGGREAARRTAEIGRPAAVVAPMAGSI